MQNKLPESKQKAKEERGSRASLIFMFFGFALVFGSLFLFQSHTKHQLSQSSVSTNANSVDSIALKKKMEGLKINNERMTAEVQKDQELLNLGNKTLNRVQPQDSGNLELSSEPNNQLHNHDRLQEERESYPDVFVPKELEADREEYDRATAQEKSDRGYVISELKRRAAAQNLNLQYDPATGDVTIDRIPQSERPAGTGGMAK